MKLQYIPEIDLGGAGREIKYHTKEDRTMEWRAGKARCKAIIITSVSFLENNMCLRHGSHLASFWGNLFTLR